MKKIKGNEILLFVEVDGTWNVCGLSLQHEVEFERDLVKVASLDISNWHDYIVGRVGWKVTMQSYVAGAAAGVNLFKFFNNGTKAHVKLASVTIEDGEDGGQMSYRLDGRLEITGYALVSSLSMSGARGGMVTQDVTLIGSGEAVYVCGYYFYTSNDEAMHDSTDAQIVVTAKE